MRKKIELLEDHTDLASNGGDVLGILVQLNTVDDNTALIVLFEPIDAADERGFAGARRAADHHPLASAYAEINILQRMERAEPLVDARHLDGDGAVLHGALTCVAMHSGRNQELKGPAPPAITAMGHGMTP